MRLLLDSHVLIWCLESPEQLTQKTQRIIENPQNQVLFSAASIWELTIKVAKGKLRLPESFVDELINTGFEALPITIEHAVAVGNLPNIDHADPFDRMLLSQAITEGLQFVTRDSHLKAYGISLIEA
jgi:PIN domain nuclease of toxin-antitoxin system